MRLVFPLPMGAAVSTSSQVRRPAASACHLASIEGPRSRDPAISVVLHLTAAPACISQPLQPRSTVPA